MGMESLMREMGGMGLGVGGADGSGSGSVPSTSTTTAGETGEGTGIGKEQEEAFKKAWEAMLVEGMDGLVGDELKPGASASSSAAAAPPNLPKEAGKQDFQAGIKAAMEKLKSSESGFKVRPCGYFQISCSFLSHPQYTGRRYTRRIILH